MGSQSFNGDRRGRPNVSIGALSKDYYSEVGEEEEEEEKDRCGICSALASNCATLDCCSHVFCFSCIDNWSSVSNFCPLCKLQFRFISCLPTEGTLNDSYWNDEEQLPSVLIKQERSSNIFPHYVSFVLFFWPFDLFCIILLPREGSHLFSRNVSYCC